MSAFPLRPVAAAGRTRYWHLDSYIMEEAAQQDPLVLDPTARQRGEGETVLHLADGPVLRLHPE